MNKVYSIFGVLFGLILLVSVVWQSIVVVHFYAYQAEIEKEFCVNIDKPELNCHGQCHLKQVLNSEIKTKAVKEGTNQSPQTALLIFQFKTSCTNLEFKLLESTPSIFEYLEPKSGTFLFQSHHPPELI